MTSSGRETDQEVAAVVALEAVVPQTMQEEELKDPSKSRASKTEPVSSSSATGTKPQAANDPRVKAIARKAKITKAAKTRSLVR